jgi:basic amino acid/polyamine antiporter, APA family
MSRHKKCCFPEQTKLKRTLGFWQASIAGIGIILGAGIYALIGVAAGSAGPALWLSFAIAGFIAALTGLSYAELSSIFKKNAAEYDYIEKAMNKYLAWIIAVMINFAAIFTAAAVALGFGGYFQGITGISIFWSATILIILLGAINLLGIKPTITLNAIFTFIEAAGLIFIIFLGIKHWGTVDLLHMPSGFQGVLQSAALVFFSFLGFEAIVKLTEETKNPSKNIPKAVIFSIGITTLIYILVAVSAVSLVSWESLAQSTSPLADAARAGLGSYTFIIMAIIALFSTTNTVLMEIITSSRMIYGMARRHAFPSIFGAVNKATQTPHYAIVVVTLLAFTFLLFQNIERVASLANLFTFLTFAAVNFATIILRKTHKKKRPFRVPGQLFGIPILPLLGGLLSLGMLYYVFLGIV